MCYAHLEGNQGARQAVTAKLAKMHKSNRKPKRSNIFAYSNLTTITTNYHLLLHPTLLLPYH